VNRLEKTKECARCGRRLKSPKAVEMGYGPVCWAKTQAEIELALEEAQKEKRPNLGVGAESGK
jgi:hypothetical protein